MTEIKPVLTTEKAPALSPLARQILTQISRSSEGIRYEYPRREEIAYLMVAGLIKSVWVGYRYLLRLTERGLSALRAGEESNGNV